MGLYDYDDEPTPPPFVRRSGKGILQDAIGTSRKTLKTIRILLIAAQRGDAQLIQRLLREVEGLVFRVETATNLTAGLARLTLGDIDIVLLDLSLPDSSGLDTFLQLHIQAPAMPVILLSGMDDETLAIRAVQKGAEDYLVKGHIDPSMLVRSIRYAIERTRRRLAEHNLRGMRIKMQMARQIQQKLFPAEAPSLAGFELGGAAYCAEATGGDYFDYIPMHGDRLGIAIADVSGHGFGPALLMASTRAYLRAMTQTHDSVAEILTLVNRFLFQDIGDDCFVTILLACLEPVRRTLVYANAGHPPGFVLNGMGEVKARLESTGYPLGIDFGGEFSPAPSIQLESGDLVVLFTDGIVEAMSRCDVKFGWDRALELVRLNRHQSPQEIIKVLYRSICEYCRDATLHDDITAIVIKVSPE